MSGIYQNGGSEYIFFFVVPNILWLNENLDEDWL